MNPAVITQSAPVESVIAMVHKAGPWLGKINELSTVFKGVQRTMRSMPNASRLLALVGLTRRTSIIGPVVAAFAAGAAVGAGAALLLAPATGSDLRRKLQREVDSGLQRVRSTVASKTGKSESLIVQPGERADAADEIGNTPTTNYGDQGRITLTGISRPH